MAMAMATTNSHGAQSATSCSVSSNSHLPASRPDGSSGDAFPAGLRVLVVDDDPICLLILDRMLRRCQYQVTTCGRATDALAKLRENPENFDVIISDVCMPDMDGFKLLELVGLEMDLPVIMMSANGETSAVMKGIKHGACDYLLKPVRMEELKNIWQHVVRKRFKNPVKAAKQEDARNKQNPSDADYNSANEAFDGPSRQSGRKRKDSREEEDEAELDNDEISTTKKPRVVWSVELHQQFVNAVNQLGVDKAVPKRILELMNVQGLTRENVASHLQKYRLYLKRISGVSHQSGGLINAYSMSADAHYGSVNPGGYMGLNELHKLNGPNQFSAQQLAQAGMLGRLGGPSNNFGIGNVDPSLILQMSALQDMKNSPLARSMSMPYKQPLQGAPQVLPYSGMSDLDQLRGIDNPISQNKVSRIVSSLQQHQLQQGLPAVSGSNNNFQHPKKNMDTLMMHSVPQKEMGSHLSNNGNCNMPIVAQQGLGSEADAWGSTASTTSGIGSSNVSGQGPGGLIGPVSVHSLPRACNIQNVYGTQSSVAVSSVINIHMPHSGNAPMLNSSSFCSPLTSSGTDDTRNHASKHIDSNTLQLNEKISNDLGQHYAMLAALKHGDGLHSSLGNQVIPQAISIAADHTQINSQHIQNPMFSLPTSSGFSIPGHDQSELLSSPGLSVGFSVNNNRDNQQIVSQSGQFKIENNYDKNQEWFAEPLNDDLLSIVLKQEHSQYGLTE